VIENQKKRKTIEINVNVILLKSPSKTWFRKWNSQPAEAADARRSVDIIYRMQRISLYFVGQVLLMTSQSRSRTEYLIPTGNIIVFEFGVCTYTAY